MSRVDKLAVAILRARLDRGEGRDDSVTQIIDAIEYAHQSPIVGDLIDVLFGLYDELEVANARLESVTKSAKQDRK